MLFNLLTFVWGSVQQFFNYFVLSCFFRSLLYNAVEEMRCCMHTFKNYWKYIIKRQAFFTSLLNNFLSSLATGQFLLWNELITLQEPLFLRCSSTSYLSSISDHRLTKSIYVTLRGPIQIKSKSYADQANQTDILWGCCLKPRANKCHHPWITYFWVCNHEFCYEISSRWIYD